MTDEEVYEYVTWWMGRAEEIMSGCTSTVVKFAAKIDNQVWSNWDGMADGFRSRKRCSASRLHNFIKAGLLIQKRFDGRKYVRLADPRDIVRSKNAKT